MDDKTLKETNRLLKTLIKRRSLWHSFLSGLFNSLGATVGVAIVLMVIAYVLRQIPLIPILGDWLSNIINDALSKTKFPLMF